MCIASKCKINIYFILIIKECFIIKACKVEKQKGNQRNITYTRSIYEIHKLEKSQVNQYSITWLIKAGNGGKWCSVAFDCSKTILCTGSPYVQYKT